MAIRQRKPSIQSRDTDKAQEKRKRQESGLEHLNGLATELGPVGGLLSTSGVAFAVERHVAFLNDTRFSHPANAEQKARIITSLQQSHGNAYVQRLLKSRAIQAKLTVSSPDDEYEQEADRVASAIVQAPGFNMQRQSEEDVIQWKIRRQKVPEEEEVLPKATDNSSIEKGHCAAEKDEKIQTKVADSRTPDVSAEIETRIKANEGNGQPLPEHVRTSFEPKFGHDFSKVRIHSNNEANELSQELGAKAFTTGRDIFFREGDYQPDSESGQRLLAHELTHVAQQCASTIGPRFGIDFSKLQNGSKSVLRQQAKEDKFTIPKLEPIFGAGKLTYSYGGEKALSGVLAGGNAGWDSTYDIDPWPLPVVIQKGKQWFGVLNRCNMTAKYWISSTTKWNDIKDFPGGSYGLKFNTKEGAKIHEKAELDAVRPRWEQMQTNIKAGIKVGMPTEINARGNYQRVWAREHGEFMTKWEAISNHTNPVGPNAEWSYYKAEYAKYKASSQKGAPEKKAP